MSALDWTVLAAYGAASLIAFVLMGVDKWKAIHRRQRIPENTLLLWCALFGAPGGWLGMQIFHHKVRDGRFFLSVPVMLAIQVALLAVYFRVLR